MINKVYLGRKNHEKIFSDSDGSGYGADPGRLRWCFQQRFRKRARFFYGGHDLFGSRARTRLCHPEHRLYANYSSLVEVVTADQMGYFEEQGITVNLVEFADGPTIIAAMENGSIDIGYIGSGAHKLCINGRAKIFCFAHCGNGDA